MNLCITYTLLFLAVQGIKNLEREEVKTKRGEERFHMNFPYWQRKYLLVMCHPKSLVVFGFPIFLK